jgi:hypothetical protein
LRVRPQLVQLFGVLAKEEVLSSARFAKPVDSGQLVGAET